VGAQTNTWTWLLQLVIPAAAGLLGVLVGGWMAGRNQTKDRQHAHIREQLSLFYAPLLAMRSEIRAKSELRVKFAELANAAWQQRLWSIRENPEVVAAAERARGPEFEKLFEYSDKQFWSEVIPLYREMLKHFKQHRWLAEPSTLSHLATLVEYVEIWNRAEARTLPHEVIEVLDHREAKLYPLYADLEAQENRLRAELGK
jgi:hypothetical protein